MKNSGEWLDTFRQTAYSWLLGDFTALDFPALAIIPFENPDLYDSIPLLSKLRNKKIKSSFTFGTINNVPLAISSPKFGAPAVGMTLDVLSLTSVETIVGIGYCGRLNSDIVCGDLIIPSASFIDEGTSSHYGGTQISHPNSELVENLKSICFKQQISHHSGPIFSTDGILREDENKLQKFISRGVIAVDMESSAAFTVGKFFNKHVVSILVGSDNPLNGECATLDKLQTGYQNAVQVALEALVV